MCWQLPEPAGRDGRRPGVAARRGVEHGGDLGHSYGAICALEAALRTPNLRTLTLYESPLGMDPFPEPFIAEIEALITSSDRDAAVTLFMGDVVGLPPEVLAELQADRAAWPPMVDTAHTLPREIRAVGGFTFDAERYRAITVPTVLLAGSESPPELRRGVELVQGAVNDALVVVMDGVDHEAVTTGPEILVAAVVSALLGR